jgi:hypothetical protein
VLAIYIDTGKEFTAVGAIKIGEVPGSNKIHYSASEASISVVSFVLSYSDLFYLFVVGVKGCCCA